MRLGVREGSSAGCENCACEEDMNHQGPGGRHGSQPPKRSLVFPEPCVLASV